MAHIEAVFSVENDTSNNLTIFDNIFWDFLGLLVITHFEAVFCVGIDATNNSWDFKKISGITHFGAVLCVEKETSNALTILITLSVTFKNFLGILRDFLGEFASRCS